MLTIATRKDVMLGIRDLTVNVEDEIAQKYVNYVEAGDDNFQTVRNINILHRDYQLFFYVDPMTYDLSLLFLPPGGALVDISYGYRDLWEKIGM